MKEEIKITKFINSNETDNGGDEVCKYFVEIENLEGEHEIEFSPATAKIEIRKYDIEITVEYDILFQDETWIDGKTKYTIPFPNNNVIDIYCITKKFANAEDFMLDIFKEEASKYVQRVKEINK